MVTNICDFQHKIGHNLAYEGDTSTILARSRGYQDRQIQWCQSNISQTIPVAMFTKISKFNSKLAITPVVYKIES